MKSVCIHSDVKKNTVLRRVDFSNYGYRVTITMQRAEERIPIQLHLSRALISDEHATWLTGIRNTITTRKSSLGQRNGFKRYVRVPCPATAATSRARRCVRTSE